MLNLNSTAKKAIATVLSLAVIGGCGYLFYAKLIAPRPMPPIKKMEFAAKCTKCGYEHTFTKEEMDAMGGRSAMYALQGGIDCPQCKGSKTQKLMTACPACQKHYLPEPGKPAVCPHCGADYNKAAVAN